MLILSMNKYVRQFASRSVQDQRARSNNIIDIVQAWETENCFRTGV